MAGGSSDIEIIGRISIQDDGTAKITMLGKDAEKLGAKMTEGAGKTKSWSSAFDSLKRAAEYALGQVMYNVANKAVNALKTVVSTGLDMNATLEKSTLQFETLLGSTDKAQAHIKDLYNFAAKTPFETQPIIDASKNLLTFGGTALDTMENLTRFGNAAAVTGSGIDEVAFVMGRAYTAIKGGKPFGEAAMRLQEMGILTPDVAAKLEKLQKSGAKADVIWNTLNGSFDRFNGAMDKQANTWEGLMSTIKDNLSMAAGTAIKPFFELIKKGQGYLAGFLQSADFSKWAQKAADIIQLVIDRVSDLIRAFTVGFGSDNDWIAGISNALYSLDSLSPVFDILGDAVVFVGQHISEFGAALAGIGAVIAGAGLVSTIAGMIAAFNPLTLVIGGIALAVGLLAAAWVGDWGGIQEKAAAVWAVIQPVLSQLWTWLQTNIPIAIQTLSTFWNTVLWPALQMVGSWIQTNLVPVLAQVGTWLATNIPIAVQTLVTVWQTVLYPALVFVWTWLSTVLLPFFQALAGVIVTVVNVAVTAAAGIWQNVLYPALQKVWSILQTSVLPVLQKIADFITKTFSPVLKAIADFIGRTVVAAFRGLTDILKEVVSWLEAIRRQLAALKLPAWMTPGSPTPWEIGLRGVADAFREVNESWPSGIGQPGARGNSSYDYSRNVAIYMQDGRPVSRVPGTSANDLDRLADLAGRIA